MEACLWVVIPSLLNASVQLSVYYMGASDGVMTGRRKWLTQRACLFFLRLPFAELTLAVAAAKVLHSLFLVDTRIDQMFG